MPKCIVVLSYIAIFMGSWGMIIFAKKFPFSTNIQDLQLSNKYLGLNGYQFWVWSWRLILGGTFFQLLDSILK